MGTTFASLPWLDDLQKDSRSHTNKKIIKIRICLSKHRLLQLSISIGNTLIKAKPMKDMAWFF